MKPEATERRLRKAAGARLEPTEEILAWCVAWLSRDRRLHRLLAARTRDFAVLTDRRLLVLRSGFFTHRPRRRVLADRLDETAVTDCGSRPGRCLRVEAPAHRPLRIELAGRADDATFAARLVEAATGTGRSQLAPVETLVGTSAGVLDRTPVDDVGRSAGTRVDYGGVPAAAVVDVPVETTATTASDEV